MLEEEEPVTRIQEAESPNPGQFLQEGEARVDLGRHGSSKQIGEADALPVGLFANEEEALQGLGELLAVEGIFDEVAPGLRDALGAVDGPGGDAREDQIGRAHV